MNSTPISQNPPDSSKQRQTRIRLFGIIFLIALAIFMIIRDHYSADAEGKDPTITLTQATPAPAPEPILDDSTAVAETEPAQRKAPPKPVAPKMLQLGSRVQVLFSARDYQEILESPDRLYLYINGRRVQGSTKAAERDSTLGIAYVGTEEGSVAFAPDKGILREYFWAPFNQTELVRLTVGNEDGDVIAVKGNNVEIRFLSTTMLIMAVIFILGLAVLVFRLASETSLIRDNKQGLVAARKPFSFSRTQLTFWFFIITASLMYVYFMTGELTEISSTALALLGISGGTAALGTAIDGRDGQQGGARSRGMFTIPKETKDFFKDLLSDGNGFSIHRLQAFVFNLFLGVVYLQQVILDLAMPEFDNNILLLLGLSSGTYAGVKALSGGSDKGDDHYRDGRPDSFGGMEPEMEEDMEGEFGMEEDMEAGDRSAAVNQGSSRQKSFPTTPIVNSNDEGPELV